MARATRKHGAPRPAARPALPRSDREVDLFFRLGRDLLAIADFNGYFRRVNPAWESALGWTAAELLSRPYLDFIHPDDHEATLAEAAKLTTGAATVSFENRYRAKDGRYHWLQWNCTPVPERGMIYADARDVTEGKMAGRDLAVQHAVARILAESAELDTALRRILQVICEKLGWEHSAVWRIDAEAGVLRCAEVWETPSSHFPDFEALSRGTTFARGAGLPGRVWASGEPAWIPNVTEDSNFPRAPVAAREGLRAGFGFPLRMGTETLGVMEFFSRQVREPDPGLLKTMATVGSQIGQLMVRQQAHEALEKYASEVSDLYNHAPCGYHSLDPHGIFVRINDTELKWLGYKREEIVGRKKFSDLLEREGLGRFVEAFAGFKRRGWVRDLEFEMLRKDGTRLPVVINSTAVYNSAGDYLMSRSTVFDNTDRKALERMKDEFISMVGHELRTPLTSMRAALGMLVGGRMAAAPEKTQQMLNIALDETDRLTRLVNDMLDLQRLELGRFRLNLQRCEAAHLVHQAADALAPMAEKAGLRIDVSAQGALLRADPDRVVQVLTNLLTNAIKFSPAGAAVRVSSEPRDAEVVFRVADEGPGIPAAQQANLFGRFHQASAEARVKGGMGLGLHICRGIVQEHGGCIGVESAPGQGATFWFTLPATRENSA
jgi:PAS domain S-box-containing protein